MAEKMKAAFLHKPRDVRIEEIDKPRPRDGEVLVRIKAVGVCGSDVHYYKSGRIGSFVVEQPMILGHESSGFVAEVGEGVKNLRVGDRVTIEPGFPCRRCFYCKTGRYNLCPDVIFYATPPVNGAFCEFQTAAADFVFPIPDDMTFEEGAMIEPLSVAVHACNRGKVSVGDVVAVLGAGSIGLLTLQVARARGAARIIAIDLSPRRLEAARRFGADETINARNSDVVAEINRLTGGEGVDVVFEAAGAVPTFQQSVGIVRRGGRIVLIGMPPQETFPMPMLAAASKEVDILGVFRYANCYPTAIGLVASGKVDVKSMITKRFSLDEVPEALRFAVEHGEEHLKIMIEI